MSFLDYRTPQDVLVMTGGHPFDREAFFAMFDALEGINYCSASQPACQALFDPGLAGSYRAFVMFDMPGMDFLTPAGEGEARPRYIDPGDALRDNMTRLLEQGHGLVCLHHAIAGWPAWPQYGDWLGGRFLYRTDTVRGERFPDSGYRHQVKHEIEVLLDHPVTRGVPERFEMCDELYLHPVFEEDVVPLLRSHHRYQDENFYSAQEAVQGRLYSAQGWEHPPGKGLVGWATNALNSPLVYLQGGDDEQAWSNPHFRTLLGNAIDWVSSDEAKHWARERNSAAA